MYVIVEVKDRKRTVGITLHIPIGKLRVMDKIFDDKDREKFLEILRRTKERYG